MTAKLKICSTAFVALALAGCGDRGPKLHESDIPMATRALNSPAQSALIVQTIRSEGHPCGSAYHIEPQSHEAAARFRSGEPMVDIKVTCNDSFSLTDYKVRMSRDGKTAFVTPLST